MLNGEDFLSSIRNGMTDFSKGQRAIARYILTDYDKAAYMTAAKLGEMAGVSESTVVRFAGILGYSGYPELQEEMADYVSKRLRVGSQIKIETDNMNPDEVLDYIMKKDIDNIKTSWENNDKAVFELAVDTILDARRIYIIGIRECEAIAKLFANFLRQMFHNVIVISSNNQTEIFDQLYLVNRKDVVIGISFPRYSKRTIKALEFSSDRNAHIIVITDNKHSPLNLYSSCNLFAESTMASITESFTSCVCIMNALTVSLCMRKKDVVLSKIDDMEDIINEYQIDDGDEIDYFDEGKIKDF